VIGRTSDRTLNLRPLWLFTKEIARTTCDSE